MAGKHIRSCISEAEEVLAIFADAVCFAHLSIEAWQKAVMYGSE